MMPGKKRTSKKDAALLELLRNSLAEEEIHQALIGALLSLDKAGTAAMAGGCVLGEAVTVSCSNLGRRR